MNLRASSRSGVGIALIFVAALVALPLAQGAWTWTSTTIRTTVGEWDFWNPSLAFSPLDDHPAIAYRGKVGKQYRLRFAAFDGSTWKDEIVDGRNDGVSASLAFNPITGFPAIAYGEPTLRLVEWNGSAWQSPVVIDSSAVVGPRRLVFFVANGKAYPSIAYGVNVGSRNKQTRWLKYAYFDGTAWKIEWVDGNNVGAGVSLAYHPTTGDAGLAFSNGWSGSNPLSTLKFAVKNRLTGAWAVESVTTAYYAGRHVTLAYDNSGTPAVVHQVTAPEWCPTSR
jgi:hypothetical protein